ncbi:MAG TPA: hypothetical protein ENK68_00580, partial [Epsilonproteobacteria bacterium]|nr:hypothetical protein [Campylobacterota bacterium]
MKANKTTFSLETYYNRISLYVIFFILIVLFASVIFFVQNEKKDRFLNIGDHVMKNFRSGLDYEMVDLLSFSMAL